MNTLELIVKFGLYILMAVSAIAAVGVVALPNLFHAALALALTLIGIAGIFLALQADFLAVIQILIYVGAVLTVVVFAIMMTERMGQKGVRQHNTGTSWLGLVGAAFFFISLVNVIRKTAWPVQSSPSTHVTVESLGKALLGPYVFPFEIISIVLIVVLIGSVIVARKDPKE